MSEKLSLISEAEEKPWYKEGLRFECTQCGQCCTGAPGFVWVSAEEREKIAQYLNISQEEFSEKYLRHVDGRISLKEKSSSYDCVFLHNNRCTVYPVRPVQCRTFPWWATTLKSERMWKEAAQYCEGINEQAPIVPLEVIIENLAK